MDDLSGLINSILSDPNSVQQLQAMASQLGLAEDSGTHHTLGQTNDPNTNQNSSRSSQSSGNVRSGYNPQQINGQSIPAVQQSGTLPNVDLDALSRVLAGLTGKPQAVQNNAPDLSALQNLLGNAGTGGSQQNSSGGGLDLSALQNLLGNAGTGGSPQNSSGGGLDLSALQNLLGNAGTGGSPQNSSGGGLDISSLQNLLGNADAVNSQQSNSGGGPDLSALQNILANMGSDTTQQGAAGSDLASALSGLLGGSGSGGADLSSLSGLLGSAAGSGQAGNTSVSALANMLGGGQNQSAGGLLSGIDISTIMKIQQAMSGLGAGQENVRLLMGLKSRLTTDRAQKVDDAVRVMQLIQFLPLIKESGILSGLDDLLGRFNLSSLLGGSSGGLGSLLNGLNLFGGR